MALIRGRHSLENRRLLEEIRYSHDKICKSICYSLKLFFNQSINTGSFLLEWKKGNISPVHKKSDKQSLNNYRQVLLPPV